MSNKWNFRVVRRARGADGRYFDFPTAATFGTEEEAREYAESFARSMDRSHAKIDVRSRRGSCGFGRGKLVATCIADGGLVRWTP